MVLLIWVVFVTRGRDGSGAEQGGDRAGGAAEDVLRQRLGDGDLSDDEFRAKLRVLRESK